MPAGDLFQVPALISKVTTMADMGIRVQTDTQELTEEQISRLFKLNGKIGWFTFSESLIKSEDLLELPDITPEFKGEKTPAERMRAVLYRLWEQGNKQTRGEFEVFYRSKMEHLIQAIKDKLQ